MNGDITRIYTQCTHCHELILSNSKTGFCGHCNTPDKRERQNDLNAEIKTENIAKGYIYAN